MADKIPLGNKLRSKAEAKIGKKSHLLQNLSLEETRTLLHELEVHQVELEMQNQELRETQHHLEEARDQYTDLFEFAPVGYLIVDEKGIIANINLTACDLLGVERFHIKGKPLSAYMGKGESVKLFLNLREAFKTGNLPSFEIQMKRKDSDSFIAMLQGTISEDRNKKSVCRISLQDVSNLREAEALQQRHEDLQREKEKIQRYLDLAPVIFLLIDTEHRVQMVNQKGCDLLGHERMDILGKNWFENFIIEANEGKSNKSSLEFRRKKLLLNPYFESNLRCKNGELRLIAWTNISLLDNNGSLIGTLSAGEDITERKKLEIDKQRYTDDLEQKVKERTRELSDALESEKQINEVKSAFISIASHELRTPLTILSSSIMLMEKYNELREYQKQEKHIRLIRSSLDHFKNILDDFLSLDQLERGNVRINKEDFDLKEFVQEIVNEMRGMLKTGQRIEYAHHGTTKVLLDKKIFRNVLLNLLSNAIKFSDTIIDLDTVLENDKLILTVRDRGIGIPEEEQQHIFVRFFRAKNAKNIQGTGLGLSIVQRYLELLEGNIQFSSQLDQGSSFTAMIPQFHK